MQVCINPGSHKTILTSRITSGLDLFSTIRQNIYDCVPERSVDWRILYLRKEELLIDHVVLFWHVCEGYLDGFNFQLDGKRWVLRPGTWFQFPRCLHVRSVVKELTLEQVSLVLRFFLLIIIPYSQSYGRRDASTRS